MKYQPKFAECPYLSTHGNICTHKTKGKYCSYKQPKNCSVYNEWVETVIMQERASPGLPALHKEEDEE